jgi:hypothetical protein
MEIQSEQLERKAHQVRARLTGASLFSCYQTIDIAA